MGAFIRKRCLWTKLVVLLFAKSFTYSLETSEGVGRPNENVTAIVNTSLDKTQLRVFNTTLDFSRSLEFSSEPDGKENTTKPSNLTEFDLQPYPIHCVLHFPAICPPANNDQRNQIRMLCKATRIQNYVIFSIALALGLPGSVFALITVATMPASPTIVYMGMLAASDFLALTLASVTMYRNSWTYEKWFVFWCGRIFQAFSHWMLALICLERYVSVRFPLQKSRVYGMKLTWMSTAAVFLVSSIPFAMMCFIEFDIYDIGYLTNTLVYNIIYIFIPLIFVVLFTILTALKLRSGLRRRQTMMAPSSRSRSSKMESELTRMMFVTAIFLFLLTLPLSFIYILACFFVHVSEFKLCLLKQALFNMIFVTIFSISFINHSINFYVYYFFAKGFRKQFLRIFSCKREAVGPDINRPDIANAGSQ
ncbi:growth hormone secretagogue receptor type 1-like [Plakobranchus ocellatus]|uniref:Growth hormone secretagogue receptor type 1-like n=1 Tax=Plakobranchus ocellatus TaxID=259542 RepID=A0AAV3XVK6_9GAST|nr:growth hormone secretagogue receptor type 1-like [Plakobranchus ocellatus]